MRALRLAIVFVLVALALAMPRGTVSAQGSPTPAYVVIVHPSNPEATLQRAFVEDAFLKKSTRWANNEAIRPVDLSPDSPVRRRFSEELLKRSVEAVRIYWQQIIFAGRDIPPPELDSDEEVVKYVLKHPGGIGYVSGTANAGGAKIVTVK
jgi:ABC-type phosphate transport system substrate-binding protein